MKLIARGAEAVILLDEGEIIKKRIKKDYRIPQIDLKLRKNRTKREARLLSLARQNGIPTPFVRDVIPEEFTLRISYIEGEKLRNIVEKLKNIKEIFHEVGNLAGKMHSGNIIHGDLTTSNMILSKGRIYLIDFGLGEVNESIEAKGTDILVFKKSVCSTHFEYEEEILDAFFRGYQESFPSGSRVIERLKLMERRGRYFSER
ncbi:bifunctional UGMP family protein/serine/threonine protein kinase [archaeon BMS3Bbin15]|nr:bifunctional UGMP family protein/serine/threonine protein kinase [archaeon BMS3Bbin15]